MRLVDADELKSMYSINRANFNTVVGIQKWIDNAPTVQAVPIEVLQEIRQEIEPKCDRINSLASVLPYTAHREIQELLCEIMDLVEPQESEEV